MPMTWLTLSGVGLPILGGVVYKMCVALAGERQGARQGSQEGPPEEGKPNGTGYDAMTPGMTYTRAAGR